MEAENSRTMGSVGRLLINLLVNGLAVFITAYILPGVVVDGFVAAIIAAVILGMVNTFIKPLLIILTLPITIMTLGLFILVINAFLVLLVSVVVPGFVVAGIWWAVLFSIVLALVSAVLEAVQVN